MAQRCDILLEETDYDLTTGPFTSDWIDTADITSVMVRYGTSDVSFGVFLQESMTGPEDDAVDFPEYRIPAGPPSHPIYLSSRFFRLVARSFDGPSHSSHYVTLAVRRAS